MLKWMLILLLLPLFTGCGTALRSSALTVAIAPPQIFNITADNTGATDPTAAIQATVDAAGLQMLGNVNGAAIHAPTGFYPVSMPIGIHNSNSNFGGDGQATVFRATGDFPVFYVS